MASEKQAAFVRSLFEQIETLLDPIAEEPGAAGLLDRVREHQSVIIGCLSNDSIAIDSIEGREVSATIDSLLAVKNDASRLSSSLRSPMAFAVGIAEVTPDKVVPNLFANPCVHCGQVVEAEDGYAVKEPGRGFETWCVECSVVTREGRRARIESMRAAEDEANAKRIAVESQFDDLIEQLWQRADVLGAQRGRNVGVAVPDSTGRNDLRFYRVRQRMGDDRATVFEVIGGRPDTVIELEPAVAALTTIVALPDLLAAMIAFGREIEQCGRCGEALTKKESRERGIGPVCARKVA